MSKGRTRSLSPTSSVAIATASLVGGWASLSFACRGVHVCTPIICNAHDAAEHGLDPHYIGGKQAEPVTFDASQVKNPGSSVKFLSNLPLNQIGGGIGSSLYGWVDPQTKREYALMGRSNGTAIVDITDPVAPKYVAEVPKRAGTASTSWREPKVVGNHMYIGVDGESVGMQIVDLTRVRAYNGSTLTLNADAVYTGMTSAIHTLAVSPGTNYLYAAGGVGSPSGGVRVIDVSNPLAPVGVAIWSVDGYTHENQVVRYNGPDAAYRGREISLNSNGGAHAGNGTFNILDVTNKQSIRRLSSKTYAQAGYLHQGWLTEDHRYFLMNDEFDEQNGVTGGKTRTHFWDVSDLDNPVYRGFYTHQTTSVDHNLYIKDGLVYMTNYTTGLHIYALDNLSSPRPDDWMHLVGSFDTYLPNDGATFNGAWNNYPFFPSGNIAVSDINGGLFVMKLDLSITPEPASLLAASALPLAFGRRARKE